MQTALTDTILMIRPVAFRMNEQTRSNNFYQKELKNLSPAAIQEKAVAEFDAFVHKLRGAGINVIVVEDTPTPSTPDSIFPNNWVSFHQNGEVILYPMFAPNRREERRLAILNLLEEKHGFQISKITDWTAYEKQHQFLEGTGSLILDRKHQFVYAARSARTHPYLLEKFAQHTDYQLVVFSAYQQNTLPIYHTNVMMALSEDLAVVCTETIKNQVEKAQLLEPLNKTHKTILNISEAQKNAFAGNMLALRNRAGQKLMVMSSQAYQSLTEEQIQQLKQAHQLLHSPLDTIETCGGGSARCMMAEVFLPKK